MATWQIDPKTGQFTVTGQIGECTPSKGSNGKPPKLALSNENRGGYQAVGMYKGKPVKASLSIGVPLE